MAETCRMPVMCSAKSWAKEKQSRKYSSRRKANPNGHDLRHNESSANGHWDSDEGRATIECEGGVNPIEKYLNIQNPNTADIASNIAAILQHTKPTEIEFEKADRYERWNRWSIYWRYSSQQQYEQYLSNVRKEKKEKKQQKNFVSAKRILSASEQYALQQKKLRKVYKPPTVEEKELEFESMEVVDHDGQTYMQLDLKRNRWLTAFSTPYSWYSYDGSTYQISAYKLFVAADEEDKDRRLFGADTEEEHGGDKKKKKRGSRKAYTVKKAKNERSKRRRERKQLGKERNQRKICQKMRWEYVGTFDGSLDDYYLDKSKSFSIDKLHKVAYGSYYDYNDDDSLKRNYAKNGKLCRWIKVKVLDAGFDHESVSCKVHGVEVNEWSQPKVPYKGQKNAFVFSKYTNDGNEADVDLDGDFDDSSDEEEFKASRRAFHIGRRIDDDEIREGKGCRLVLTERRKAIPFVRMIDGATECGYWSSYYIEQYIERKKQTRKTKREITKRSGRVDNYDEDGVPRW